MYSELAQTDNLKEKKSRSQRAGRSKNLLRLLKSEHPSLTTNLQSKLNLSSTFKTFRREANNKSSDKLITAVLLDIG